MENKENTTVTKVYSAYLDAELPLPFAGRKVLSDGRTISLLPHKAFVWIYRTLLADTVSGKDGKPKGYNVKVSYEDLTEGYRYPVIRCHIVDKYGHEGNRIGSAHMRSLTTEIARMYPPEMAEKRAFDRAMADYLGLEDIIPEEAYVPTAEETAAESAATESKSETPEPPTSAENTDSAETEAAETAEPAPKDASSEEAALKPDQPTEAQDVPEDTHEKENESSLDPEPDVKDAKPEEVKAAPEEKPDTQVPVAKAETRVAEAPFDPVIPDDPAAEPEDPADILPDMPAETSAPDPKKAESRAEETKPASDPEPAKEAPVNNAKETAADPYGSMRVTYGQYAREFHGKATVADMFRIDAERQAKDPDYPAMADFFIVKYNPAPNSPDYEKKVALKEAVKKYAEAIGYKPKANA